MTLEDKITQLTVDVALIKEKILNINKDVDTVWDQFPCKQHIKRFDIIEKRLTALEIFKQRIIGAIILGNGLTAIIVATIVKVWK